MFKLQRVLAGVATTALLAVGLLSGLATAPAIASAATYPRGRAHRPAHNTVGQRHAGRRVSARMKVRSYRRGAHPNGVGQTVGDCGTAGLYVDSSSNYFNITLNSTEGPITGGYYSISTNGLFSVSQTDGVGDDSPYWFTSGTLTDPGFWPGQATAQGLVVTTNAVCYFYVTAPWIP